MKYIYWFALLLIIVGALNFGLMGVVRINLIDFFFEKICFPLSRVIYCLIGLSGLFVILYYKKMHSSK